jgi:hypothetical protein
VPIVAAGRRRLQEKLPRCAADRDE